MKIISHFFTVGSLSSHARHDGAPTRPSFVELIADGPQRPHFFVSHFWGEPHADFVACVAQHTRDRAYGGGRFNTYTGGMSTIEGADGDDARVWVCAYAVRVALRLEPRIARACLLAPCPLAAAAAAANAPDALAGLRARCALAEPAVEPGRRRDRRPWPDVLPPRDAPRARHPRRRRPVRAVLFSRLVCVYARAAVEPRSPTPACVRARAR